MRAATAPDIAAVIAAVGELLRELGGTPPPGPAMVDAARALLRDPDAGAVLVAEPVGEGRGRAGAARTTATAEEQPLVGVLAASWQSAIHAPGRYALIQDLWVAPGWRGSGVGAGLLAALFELARERGAARVEVGLPRESFPRIAATEAFYIANGFTALGARMRRSLP
ncbi:MAG TPA: GNAT family N-acetyltransferase [Solirubrobacteraceae bacterium]|nr:GNAT family N-acetyltransferase [Solirubrobacteraceae bacterium]